ncbi:hypothetical protein M440DRAFT_1389219 [Trichoderma longibrachiatum ATCC 18648]|uniref:Orotidine 5'-phosphate decarboxylase n=1 Tax=Trichoderma longibrachiatum ATCC 18648 TaxID=983965 RepID=A0A2T4CCA8_TRILO|nr:hypothetical protein M440DRAFT_1389219 [Trichoderma longibrachiatum ATCC 18648]
MAPHPTLKATFAARSETATHPLTAYLFKLMDLKASNLCLSADVPTARELLYLADKIGPSIACVEAAREHKDFVMGFISQETLNTEPDDAFIHMTPGCQLPPDDEDPQTNGSVGGDGQGQQYNTPHKLIGIAGSDIAIVGRGILKASDPVEEAERYRSAAWKAYTERLLR